MSTSLVQKVSALSTSKVVFSDLKKQGKGGFLSFVNYKVNDKSQRLIIQIPKMFSPFGASCYKKEELPKGQLPKYNVGLSLDTTDKKIKALKDFLLSLDKLACKTAASNKDWLKQLAYKNKKKKSKSEVAEDLEDNKYSSIIKESRNEKYPDTFTPKVPIDWKNSQPALQVYNKQKQKLDITFDNIEQLLPKLSELKGLVQVSHVWFVSGKFGITLKLLQALSYPKETLSGLSLLDDSDDEEAESDEEEEEDDEESEVEVESDDESDEE